MITKDRCKIKEIEEYLKLFEKTENSSTKGNIKSSYTLHILFKDLLPKTLGGKLKYFRQYNNISLLSVNDYLKKFNDNISRYALRAYENDLLLPRKNELTLMASFYDVDIAVFDLESEIKKLTQRELIRFYRRNAYLKQYELAEKTDILLKRICDLERGKGKAKISELIKISMALNIDYRKLGIKELGVNDRIRLFRELTVISQANLANVTGIGERNIWNYEKGIKVPTYSDIMTLAYFFNIEPQTILPNIEIYSKEV